MRIQTLSSRAGERLFAIVLESGEEAMPRLEEAVERLDVTAAQVTAIGAFERAELKYFHWPSKTYEDIAVDEQVEVASLIGDVAVMPDGRPALHLHAVLGRRDGSAFAGHFAGGLVRPTLEVMLTEAPAHLAKAYDPQTGLCLIRPRVAA